MKTFIPFPSGSNSEDFLSLGRNGIMQTSGIHIWNLSDRLELNPVTSKGLIGRSSITIPSNKAFLLQFAQEITRLANSQDD